LDEYNRAVGKGHRKNCSAVAYVYPGNGNIWINNCHYSAYFRYYADRLNITLPLIVTDTLTTMDAHVRVLKGGPSGQSTAARLAIANGLAHYDPKLAKFLNFYELLRWDPRKHERKKPRKLGARKSKQWKRR